MASPAYEQLLAVQALDLDLRRLRHRHENHPRRTELTAATAETARIAALIETAEAQIDELERDLRRLTGEVELIETKRTDIDGKLYGGTVTASKELLALQDEATLLLERQREIEDGELEIMERQETLSSEVDSHRSQLAEATRAEEQAAAALSDELAALDAEIADVEARRAEAARPTPDDLLGRYEALIGQFDGIVVARLVDGRCDGCHIALSAVAVDQLRKADDGAVVTCEECGRLLVI